MVLKRQIKIFCGSLNQVQKEANDFLFSLERTVMDIRFQCDKNITGVLIEYIMMGFEDEENEKI